MRCNNCGYENDPNVRNCVKCGQVLSDGSVMGYGRYYDGYGNSENRQTRIQNGNPLYVSLKKTVVQGGEWENQKKPTVIQATCPRCHYPMNGDYCANCGFEVQSEKPSAVKEHVIPQFTCKCQNCGKEVSYEFRYCPDCGTEIEKKTINPFDHKVESKPEIPKHQCTLTLLDEAEGKLMDGDIKEYSGDSIILNRDNTEPGNLPITSQEQAELTFEDNEWRIQNRSGYGATMVAASRKISLQSGDIILLGNRRFRFNIK